MATVDLKMWAELANNARYIFYGIGVLAAIVLVGMFYTYFLKD
jgi:hypothetical protein